MNELQAIYKNENGWGIQETSSDLPSDVIRDFEQLSLAINETYDGYQGKYNQKIFVCKYMSGYVYHMYSDGEGFTDHVGRKNILTHGYMFPINENPDIIRDDTKLVALSYDNFSDHISPYNSSDGEAADIFADMEICGLDKEKLSLLLTCVYETLLDTSNQTLHIKVSDENMIKSCIRCIYHFMPYSLRKEVSYSTIPLKDGTTTITFITPDFPVLNFNHKYFDLQTTDHNISYLDAITDKTTFSSKFICNTAEHDKHSILIALLDTFDKYEKDFKLHDNTSISQRITILQLIYLITSFENHPDTTDKNVVLLLNRLIRINFESPNSNNTLIKLLNRCSERKLKLNDSIMEALQKKRTKTKNNDVKDRIFDYTCENMLMLPPEKIAQQLIVSYTDDYDYFSSVVECIREKDNSTDKQNTSHALDIMFADCYKKSDNYQRIEHDNNDSIIILDDYLKNVMKADFTPYPKVYEFVKERLEKIFYNYLNGPKYSTESFLDIYNEYRDYIKNSRFIRNEDINPILLKAKKKFWSQFDITNFTEDNFKLYEAMAHDTEPVPKNWEIVSKLMKLMKEEHQKSLQKYLDDVAEVIEELSDTQFFAHDIARMQNENKKYQILKKLIKNNNIKKYRNNGSIVTWCDFICKLSQKMNVNAYTLVFDFDIQVMYMNPDENYNNADIELNNLQKLQENAEELADDENCDFPDRVNEISNILNEIIQKRSKKKGIFGKFKK